MAYHLKRSDLTYAWGGSVRVGKFLALSRLAGVKKLVMFWCGSDTLVARGDYEAGKLHPWVAKQIHWAGSPWLAEEVRAMGLKCEYVPSTWVPAVDRLPELPNEFSVLAFLRHTERKSLYGTDVILEAARALPAVRFTLIGIVPGQKLQVPENVTVHPFSGEITPFYKAATVIWRPTRHDGLSFMALEALAYGRHVMWSYPFPGVTVAKDAKTGILELQRLLDLHHAKSLDLNRAGADHVARNFSAANIRDNILARWKNIVEPHIAASVVDSQCVPGSSLS